MRVIIKENSAVASAMVADYIVGKINEAHPTPEHPFVLGLPTGSTPLGVYSCLVKKYRASEVSFRNVVTFNMDEYVGIPRDHPSSYHTYMWQEFFSHIDILPENVHIPNGEAPDLAAECEAYEAKIQARGPINLFLAGVGEDGHIAFNEPFSSLASRTRVKTLDQDTIASNMVYFDNDPSKVPREAITVGVSTVLAAQEIVALAFGKRKAAAIHYGVEKGVSSMYTVSALQLHSRVALVIDEDATLELKVKTVRRFKEAEAMSHPDGLRVHPRTTTTSTAPKLPLTPPDSAHPAEDGLWNASPVSETGHPYIITPTSSNGIPISTSLGLATPRIIVPSVDEDADMDLIPDSMASRVGDPAFMRRLTPDPETQREKRQMSATVTARAVGNKGLVPESVA